MYSGRTSTLNSTNCGSRKSGALRHGSCSKDQLRYSFSWANASRAVRPKPASGFIGSSSSSIKRAEKRPVKSSQTKTGNRCIVFQSLSTDYTDFVNDLRNLWMALFLGAAEVPRVRRREARRYLFCRSIVTANGDPGSPPV